MFFGYLNNTEYSKTQKMEYAETVCHDCRWDLLVYSVCPKDSAIHPTQHSALYFGSLTFFSAVCFNDFLALILHFLLLFFFCG